MEKRTAAMYVAPSDDAWIAYEDRLKARRLLYRAIIVGLALCVGLALSTLPNNLVHIS